MEFITNSPEETEKIGAAVGRIIPAGTVLAYRGDLGAGKCRVMASAPWKPWRFPWAHIRATYAP